MKKSLLALAVLGAFAGVASAQSSVTLSGTVDVNGRYVKNGDTKGYSLSTDGINSSQLVFSGIEDLGSGLKAGFVLNAGVNPDTGTSNVATSADGTPVSKLFNRRSTVSLWNGLGELRLGRDYTPTFWTPGIIDPFGANGIGTFYNVISTLGSGASTLVRADNSIGYHLPAGIGGLYGQVMVAAGENGTAPTQANNKYVGGRIGFGAGPFDISGAASETTINANDEKYKLFNIGASYNFGFLKLGGLIQEGKYLAKKQDLYHIGVVVPFGQSEIHAGYTRADAKGDGTDANDADQAAITYVYNLSKRTAVYATGAYIKNKGASTFVIGGFPPSGGATPQKSTGAEFGIRHFF